MLVDKEVLVFLVVCAVWQTVDAAAMRTSPRHQQTGLRASRQDTPYFWMCPEVLCAPVPRSCSFIEYIVFQYDYEVRGRVVNVRCESCEYCLDGPPTNSARHRRSTSRHRDVALHSSCPTEVVCPSLPATCVDERLTDVLINGVVCKRCPACYDSTLVNNSSDVAE